MHILILDHDDSYTLNLVHLIPQAHSVAVERAHALTSLSQCKDVDAIILSPGPGRPEHRKDFGVALDLLRSDLDIPVLGVCLGHQGLAYAFGATIRPACSITHGQISRISHDGQGLFKDVAKDLDVVRYNSLTVDSETLPTCLEVTAWGEESTEGVPRRSVQALQHRSKPFWSVQFHPESICSQEGDKIMLNFLDMAQRNRGGRRAASEADVTLCPVTPRPPPSFAWTVRWDRLPDATASTPESVFLEMTRHSEPGTVVIWLDSASAGRGSEREERWSYLGSSQESISYRLASRTMHLRKRHGSRESSCPDFFDEMARRQAAICIAPLSNAKGILPPFVGGWVGYFGYEMKDQSIIGPVTPRQSQQPDSQFALLTQVLAYEHTSKSWIAISLSSLIRSRKSQILGHLKFKERIKTWMGVHMEPQRDVAQFQLVAQATHPERYLRAIDLCRENIYQGESYELCLTTSFECELKDKAGAKSLLASGSEKRSSAPYIEQYRQLRRQNPAAYSAYLHFPASQTTILSTSPERFIEISKDGHVEMKPIKGTTARPPRSNHPTDELARRVWHDQDRQAALALSEDVKERAELLMITDLIRNDLTLVCERGSVHVVMQDPLAGAGDRLADGKAKPLPSPAGTPSFFAVESSYSVHSLVSTVRGQIKGQPSLTPASPTLPDKTLLNPVTVVQAVFPPGSMTGSPKVRSVEILQRLETQFALQPDSGRRGIYSGVLGYFSASNDTSFSVVIRTLVIEPEEIALDDASLGAPIDDDSAIRPHVAAVLKARVGAGGAITYASEPLREWQEVMVKVASVINERDVVQAGRPQRQIPTSTEGVQTITL